MDLTVPNNNNPDRVRATNTPGDVQALIASTFQRWWPNVYSTTPTVMFGAMGYEFSTPFLCFAGQPMEQEPRPAWNNTSAFTNANVSSTTWLNFYGVISLANDGLSALDRGVRIGNLVVTANKDTIGADDARARAFGKFMQGVAHGYLALMWDKAVIIDENTNVDTLVDADLRALSGRDGGGDQHAQGVDRDLRYVDVHDSRRRLDSRTHVHEQGSVAPRAHVHRALRDVRRADARPSARRSTGPT